MKSNLDSELDLSETNIESIEPQPSKSSSPLMQTIVLVDSHEGERSKLSLMLQKSGVEVVQAMCLEEALRIVAWNARDLQWIFINIELNWIDKYQLVQKIRAITEEIKIGFRSSGKHILFRELFDAQVYQLNNILALLHK